jgi:hypothetical protein
MKLGKRCGKALARLFRQNPAQLQAAAEKVEIEKARVDGTRGYVFYSTPGRPAAYLPLSREGKRWKVATISGSSAPKQ